MKTKQTTKTPHRSCGHKTNNAGGICSDCLNKIKMLNQIRELLETTKFTRKSKKRKIRYGEYFAATTFGVNEQICWHCEKAGGFCSWSESFVPVEGWTAVKSGDSYAISSCPEYVPLIMKREMRRKVGGCRE